MAFPSDLRFRYPWRIYQSRVLEQLSHHLNDRRLHVVAAPGAGKTVLGWEVAKRINLNTLVFAPTVTIRDQWLHRLSHDFDSSAKRDFAGTELDGNFAVTIITYQALHAERRKHGVDELRQKLSRFQTFVLDEAHHLRNEWWQALAAVTKDRDDLHLVSLTATPPYDVAAHEWNRYYGLCGPIDAEISIPELVRTQDLCPHQDYIWMVKPTGPEQDFISAFRARVEETKKKLLESRTALLAVLGHPWIGRPADHLEEIAECPELFLAQVAFVKARGIDVEAILEAAGLGDIEVPFSDENLEMLLSDLASAKSDEYAFSPRLLKQLLKDLHLRTFTYQGRISLTDNERVARLLGGSNAKVAAIGEILDHEWNCLKEKLRGLVLVNLVREEFLRSPHADSTTLAAVPLYQQLLNRPYSESTALLTGKVAAFSKTVLVKLESTMRQSGFAGELRAVPMPDNPGHCYFSVSDSLRSPLMDAVRTLLYLGDINVLVGTAALLGEGWDAPAINTLVMGTSGSTHVFSNQLRGRAIRIDAMVPQKVSNIWHLACIDPTQRDGGEDLRRLTRRFESFPGLSYSGNSVESGIQRLSLPEGPYGLAEMSRENENIKLVSHDRALIRKQWFETVGDNPKEWQGELLRCLITEKKQTWLLLSNPMGDLFKLAGFAGMTAGFLLLDPFLYLTPPAWHAMNVSLYVGLSLGVGKAVRLPFRIRSLWHSLWTGTGPRTVKKMARVVLDSLRESEPNSTELQHARLTTQEIDGELHLGLTECPTYESNLFLVALSELLSPVENPRYVILKKLSSASITIAVPERFSRTKPMAELFLKHWRKEFHWGELIFTKTAHGKKFMARAKLRGKALRRLAPRSLTVWESR